MGATMPNPERVFKGCGCHSIPLNGKHVVHQANCCAPALVEALEACAEALDVCRGALGMCGDGDGKGHKADAEDMWGTGNALNAAKAALAAAYGGSTE
jgi:hypothetical protein